MNPRLQVLLCDDDSLFQLAVKHALKDEYVVLTARDTEEAKVILRSRPIDILLLDIQLRTPDEGLEALPAIRAIHSDLPIVMISGRQDFAAIREAMRRGARDYVPKDFEPEELKHTLAQALEHQALLLRSQQREFELRTRVGREPTPAIIGKSTAIESIRRAVSKLRESSATVLIQGESGTGKERVARALRRTLPDGTLEPFVAVDCATLQAQTAESALFGHEKGAFSGAERLHRGFFEEANGGTLFFDEIGNLSLQVQAKLLRAIQEKEIRRLGSTRPIRIEVRFVAATNEPLERAVEAGRFKADLYQRLNVVPLTLPPLRERPEDIPELLAHFSPGLQFNADTLEALRLHRWPGNARELENLARWLETFAPGGPIRLEDLPPRVRESHTKSGNGFYSRVEDYERQILTGEHRLHAGNVSRMAVALRMDRSHLHHKLKRLGIGKNPVV